MAALADARAKAGQQILLRKDATTAQCNSAAMGVKGWHPDATGRRNDERTLLWE